MWRCLQFFSIKSSINVIPQTVCLRSISTFNDDLIHYDHHKSIKIDIERLVNYISGLNDLNVFEQMLEASLKEWKSKKLRSVWFKINLEHSKFIPSLVKNGFKYHHAKQDYASLVKWISETKIERIPSYPFTNIGVGGLVMNKSGHLLLVKEKTFFGIQRWKFAGGYARKGEEFGETAEREILEETGVQTKFNSIILIRHHHRFQFDSSDIYIVCDMQLEEKETSQPTLKPDRNEIADVQWIHYKEAMEQLSPFNRSVVLTYLQNQANRIRIRLTKIDSPPLGVVTCYSINQTDSKTNESQIENFK